MYYRWILLAFPTKISRFAYYNRLSLPPLLLRLPTHQPEWLASPRRFRLGSLQPPSALQTMDNFPDFG